MTKKIAGRVSARGVSGRASSISKSAWVARRMHHIVKRGGHAEPFDQRKAYASCYYACRSTHMKEQECELVSKTVLGRLKQWLARRRQVNSTEIFNFIGRELEKINEEAAFMYKTHRDIS